MEQNDRLSIRDGRKLMRQLRNMRSQASKDFEQFVASTRLDRISLAPDAPLATLLDALRGEELAVRAEAAQRLGVLGEQAAIEPLLAALHDRERYMRAEAARALGQLGDGVPLEPLEEAIRDRDGSVRVAAVQALGMLGERVSIELLLMALNDAWPPVREAAVVAYGKLRRDVSLDVVVAALQDEDKFVRIAALRVLGDYRDQAPLEPLIAALGDVQKSVREVAVKMLGGMGQRVPVDRLMEAFAASRWPPMREGIVRVMDMLGEQVPEHILQKALHDEWPPVREAAELALQGRRERQREAAQEISQSERIKSESGEKKEEAEVAALEAAAQESKGVLASLLALPDTLFVLCRNALGKPYDQSVQFLRSWWDWLWSWPTTLVEQLQTRQAGNGKMFLSVVFLLVGVWLILARRPRGSERLPDAPGNRLRWGIGSSYRRLRALKPVAPGEASAPALEDT